jgi:hypothetical protein
MPPAQPATATGADAARLAAQKAFFRQAMDRPAAAAAPTPAAAQASVPTVRTVQLQPSAKVDAPARILRPGSLLDIRV